LAAPPANRNTNAMIAKSPSIILSVFELQPNSQVKLLSALISFSFLTKVGLV